jgi:hypothetical protein
LPRIPQRRGERIGRPAGERRRPQRRQHALDRRPILGRADGRRVAVRRALDEQEPLASGRVQVELDAHRRRDDRVALAVDDEERRADPPDLARGVEPPGEQHVDRVRPRGPRVAQERRDRRRRGLDDDAVHVRVARRELERDRAAERVPVDEPQRRIRLVPAQLLPRRFRVFVHRRLGGCPAAALAEAAVVDHQDGGAGAVDRRGHVDHAGDRAAGAVQQQHDRRVAVVRHEPAVHPLALRADAQPHVHVAQPEHPGVLPHFGLGEADEPVGEVPEQHPAGHVGHEGRGGDASEDAADRPQHGPLAYSRTAAREAHAAAGT